MRTVFAAVAGAVAVLVLSGFDSVAGRQTETRDLRLVWVEEADEASMRTAEAVAQAQFEAVAGLVGMTPDHKPLVVLRGQARSGPGVRGDYPYVDDHGIIHLFRFAPDVRNYFNAFAHELVHALRIERKDGADWFFEEGFAEFVRLRVDDGTEGFPWFGHPVAVAAAGYVVEGTAIPLPALRERHVELNQPCRAQSYVLRAAFFDWLGRRYGDDKVLAMSREDRAGSEAHYLTHFGEPLAALAARWEDEARAHHDASAFRAWREDTPIRFVPLCEAD